jgi:hypothetical protein
VTGKRHPIAADDIDRVFNDNFIESLASELPAGADLKTFGRGVREAARIYAHESRRLNANMLSDEIAGLRYAADRQKYDQLAELIKGLSKQASSLLTDRGNHLGIKLPPHDALSDPERREDACQKFLILCTVGADRIKGRRRPGGKQSQPTWRPLLYAPNKQRHFPRRDAERNFVMWLQAAWVEATGEAPPHTARHGRYRNVGGFVGIARQCLPRVGAPDDADIVELINELNRWRRSRRTHIEDPFE